MKAGFSILAGRGCSSWWCSCTPGFRNAWSLPSSTGERFSRAVGKIFHESSYTIAYCCLSSVCLFCLCGLLHQPQILSSCLAPKSWACRCVLPTGAQRQSCWEKPGPQTCGFDAMWMQIPRQPVKWCRLQTGHDHCLQTPSWWGGQQLQLPICQDSLPPPPPAPHPATPPDKQDSRTVPAYHLPSCRTSYRKKNPCDCPLGGDI